MRQVEAMRRDATPYLELIGGQGVSFYERHGERYDGQDAKREVDQNGTPSASSSASDDLDIMRNAVNQIPAALRSVDAV